MSLSLIHHVSSKGMCKVEDVSARGRLLRNSEEKMKHENGRCADFARR